MEFMQALPPELVNEEIAMEKIPSEIIDILGKTHSERIGRMVNDVITTTLDLDLERIKASPAVMEAARGCQVIFHRFRRRKNSHSRKGHRQRYTKVRIGKIAG